MKKLFLSFVLLFLIHSSLLSNPSPSSLQETPDLRAELQTFENAPAKSSTALDIQRHRVWINLTNSEGLFKQILIGYITGATNGWDHNYDALTMDANPYADFYSINEGMKLIIQGRALPFDPADTVPLGYRSAIKGDLTISIDHTDGDLNSRTIYLHDKETGTVHNLNDGGYTFSTLTGVFTDRFFISYSPDKNLGTDDFKNIPEHLIIVSKNKTITIRSSRSALKAVYVFDITGKLYYSSNKLAENELEISSIQAADQILLVKTILDNGFTITKKVLF